MAVEMENVMDRLSRQTRLLQEEALKAQTGDADDRALMVQGLALVSEAILRIGRDVRQLKLQIAAGRQG